MHHLVGGKAKTPRTKLIYYVRRRTRTRGGRGTLDLGLYFPESVKPSFPNNETVTYKSDIILVRPVAYD